jgi:hypothetical protein
VSSFFDFDLIRTGPFRLPTLTSVCSFTTGGWNSVDSDMVVAIGKGLYDRNNGNNCGQGVRIKANGKSVYAVVVDSCPSCGDSDLDMSPAVFQALANGGLGDGVMEAKWNFLKKN